MFSLAFILMITGICVFISYSFSSQITWFVYYKGIVIGLFVSGIILQAWNKRKRDQESKENK
jgi:hypothetical protein